MILERTGISTCISDERNLGQVEDEIQQHFLHIMENSRETLQEMSQVEGKTSPRNRVIKVGEVEAGE